MPSVIKKVLITAGPTWAAIDPVRVISNTASGETGILLADKFLRAGFKVTLLMGPGNLPELDKRIKIVRFRFFEELEAALKKLISSGGYHLVIHAAAVSDYRLLSVGKQKISSDRKTLNLRLVAAPKLIGLFSRWDKRIKVVGFKYQPQASFKHLLLEGKNLLKRYGLRAVVANTQRRGKYEAYFLGPEVIGGPYRSKKQMVEALYEHLA